MKTKLMLKLFRLLEYIFCSLGSIFEDLALSLDIDFQNRIRESMKHVKMYLIKGE